MTEAELQANVIDAARRLGFLAYHTHDSRRSAAGFPDLVVVHRYTGGVLFAELKSDRGVITPEQAEWLTALRRGGAAAYVWRPADWPEPIVDTLRSLR